MPPAPLPENEHARLAALRRYDILDSGPETAYDDLAKIAAQICGTPIALITLVDAERQWFKARVGMEALETPRDHAFCAYTIHESATLVVPDAARDERFADNPLVLGDPRIRFYAGAPLQTDDGIALGSLCVIDREPRQLSPEQKDALEAIGRHVVRLIELRHRSRLFESLVENNPAVMSVKDSAARLVFVNAAWKEHFGRDGEDPLGATTPAWLGVDEGAAAFEADVAVLRSRRPLETIHVLPSDAGEQTWFTMRFPLEGIGGQLMAGDVSLDVTKTVLTERRWREAEKKFEQLCAASPDAIITGDANANVVFWNAAAEVMFGYAEAEIAGTPWATLIAPEDRERFGDPERWMRRTTREFTGVRRDGSAFPAEVSLARWRADGREFQTCFVRDLTGRRAIESQLEHARRVESLGHVAASVAHEFNNVMMAIAPFNTVITKVAGRDQRVQQATGAIERSIARAKGIVEQILSYARANAPVRKTVNLAAWLESIREEMRAIAGDAITVRVEVPAAAVPVSCDVRQLEQVILNLVSNARDAMDGRGVIAIALDVRDFCADAMLRDGERCARVSVADSGGGMTEETMRRMFEPLFTTKAHGTGIGLALARRLIEQHGGVLTATSEVGRGSEFVIHLPLLQ
jgi:two-component system cell cycle sensor histidine kinase/response regulator CckA